MKSKKPKKKIQWRKQAIEKRISKVAAPGLIPTGQNSTAPQSFREVLMKRRQMAQQQPNPFPNYISQHSIGMDQYNRL